MTAVPPRPAMSSASLRTPAPADPNQISLLALGAAILRWRRRILASALVCGGIALALALIGPRSYVASATFIPQTSEGPTSSLAAAASQFGIQVPSSGGGWGPPVYVRLLSSPALLESILLDTIPVAEEGGRRATLMELFELNDPTPALRREHGIRALQLSTSAQEVKTINAVQVDAQTRWPSVSLYIVNRLVRAVNEFNVQRRRSQAGAERQFVDSIAADAERTLRNSEDRLQQFMQTNRSYGASSELSLQRDRLQRDVALRQQMYTALLQSREEARIREVRSQPVVTVLEPARLPVRPVSRKAALKTILGLLIGTTLGVIAALLAQALGRARRAPDDDAAEFMRLVDEATPRFLKRRRG